MEAMRADVVYRAALVASREGRALFARSSPGSYATPRELLRLYDTHIQMLQAMTVQAMASYGDNPILWRGARKALCDAVHGRAELLQKMGYASRWPGDAHSASNDTELLVIAVEMAVYDPRGFADQYSAAQKDCIKRWWSRSFKNCTLEQARKFARSSA